MELDDLARAQHACVSRTQALEHLTEGEVRARLSGRWKVVHPGVYQTHTGPLDWFGRASAALLHAGTGSALALSAAAYVHGIIRKPPAVIIVAIPHSRTVIRVPGIRIVRRRQLVTTTRRKVTVTGIPQTVLELAAVPGATRAEAIGWVADAVRETSATVSQLADHLAGLRRHPHRRALELAMGVVGEGAQSVLEVEFAHGVVEVHGLPAMSMQVPDVMDGGGVRRDFEAVEFGVIVEVDGVLGHLGAGVVRDRLRDRRAARQGKTTLRAGWVDVEFEPCELALDLHGALSARGWTGPIKACSPTCRARAVS